MQLLVSDLPAQGLVDRAKLVPAGLSSRHRFGGGLKGNDVYLDGSSFLTASLRSTIGEAGIQIVSLLSCIYHGI